jgi:hypothetical protein
MPTAAKRLDSKAARLRHRAGMKPTPISAAVCRVCESPRAGKGGFGLCARCYMAEYRGKKPTPTPMKRAPGTWRNVQAHVDLEVYQAMEKAAKKAHQSIPVWLNDAIRQRLERSE